VTATQYKTERELRGTQGEVSAMLGVSRVTIARRETGARPVIQEAWLALLALPKKKKHNKRSLPMTPA
jgi:DNA-binding XRE family transcriptional regulator